ncbi:UNVERIFIED_CONTAM: hypothetical protein HHA_454250 [Hammondia hammondi]|eukprot:XP_008887690.1 hypothetical protein HHA_454250 [Hammondia hammondi]
MEKRVSSDSSSRGKSGSPEGGAKQPAQRILGKSAAPPTSEQRRNATKCASPGIQKQ